MRIRFSFLPGDKKCLLPLNYSYYLASMIYRSIERADSDLSFVLHRPNVIKFFTFSKLMTKHRKILGDQLLVDSDGCYFEFSTPRKDLAVALVNGLLEKPYVEIAGESFVLSEIHVLPEKEISGCEVFTTLSPISVTTVEENNGHRRIVDLYPDTPKFYENLRKNLIKKYVTFYGREPEDKDVEIKVKKAKPKRIKIKNTYHRCSEMVFEARGSRELLKIGYQAGFGERNSMGFGMVKVANGRSRKAGEDNVY